MIEQDSGAGPSVAFATLGCKVNQSEAAAMAGLFVDHGYRVVPFETPADVYVVHTCTVTRASDHKCRQMIRRAVRSNPKATVVVSGCYPQVAPAEVAAIPGVKVVIGARERARLVELVDRARTEGKVCLVTPWEEGPAPFEELLGQDATRARALVRVEEGCREFCTYCIVPFARGPVRSLPQKAVRSEVERLVRAGYQELVLTGTNLGAYGQDLGDTDLAVLLRDLSSVPGLGRLRLSSVEPHYFTPELVAVVTGEEKICPHWHIPLQSGDAAILRSMARSYTPEGYEALLNRLRQGRPLAAITTDVIVGFPGEDEQSFERSYGFVEAMGFSRLHVFPYSRRRGTPAAALPGQVAAGTKEERSRRLRSLGRRLAECYAGRFVGRELTVVVEREVPGKTGYVRGHSENYLTVSLPGGRELVGRLLRVRLTARVGEELVGEQASEGGEFKHG